MQQVMENPLDLAIKEESERRKALLDDYNKLHDLFLQELAEGWADSAFTNYHDYTEHIRGQVIDLLKEDLEMSNRLNLYLKEHKKELGYMTKALLSNKLVDLTKDSLSYSKGKIWDDLVNDHLDERFHFDQDSPTTCLSFI